jgi:2-oxoglutarate ferredoxin oxidoreductase subunit alpha
VAPAEFTPFAASRGQIPEMPSFGSGYHTYVTGLTHDERGLPATDDAHEHTQLVERLCSKIADDTEKLTRVEADPDSGATVGIVSYGISSRSAAGAVRLLRRQGTKVAHLRLIGIFPFPERAIQDFAENLDRIVVPELNLGQICHLVREAVEGKASIEKVSKIGGEIIRPDEVARAVVNGGIRV